jgi:hypothetical protein
MVKAMKSDKQVMQGLSAVLANNLLNSEFSFKDLDAVCDAFEFIARRAWNKVLPEGKVPTDKPILARLASSREILIVRRYDADPKVVFSGHSYWHWSDFDYWRVLDTPSDEKEKIKTIGLVNGR